MDRSKWEYKKLRAKLNDFPQYQAQFSFLMQNQL